MKERRRNKRNKIIEIVKEHLKNNIKEYFTVAIIFLIGILIGIIFINQIDVTNLEQIQTYLNKFVEQLKNDYQIDTFSLFKETAISNTILAVSLWLIGTTVVGIPFVYAIILARGFCFGYTISSSLITFGIGKGILFSITSLFLQSCILIPCMFALAVSGKRLQQSITKDKRRENIKIEIYRHTIFSAIVLVALIISAFVESYISGNLLMCIIQYIG